MEGETLPEARHKLRRRDPAEERSGQDTQENGFLKRRLMTKSPKRPITLVPHPEDPVKLKNTDLRNDESVMNIDENLLIVVNTLTKDETVHETNPDEDNEMPKFTGS